MSLRVRIGRLGVLGHGRRAHRRIDGGVDERLVAHVGATLGAKHLRGHGREVAAGGVAREAEARVPDPGARRVRGGPAGGVDAVVRGPGRPVLGCEAVVDVEHGHPRPIGDPGTEGVVAPGVAEHPPAAVEPQHRGQHLAPGVSRSVGPHRDLVAVTRPEARAADLDAGRDRSGDPGEGCSGRREPGSAAGDLVR